jgi:hypothetical protein
VSQDNCVAALLLRAMEDAADQVVLKRLFQDAALLLFLQLAVVGLDE